MKVCRCAVITPSGKRKMCRKPATSERQGVPVCDEHAEPTQDKAR